MSGVFEGDVVAAVISRNTTALFKNEFKLAGQIIANCLIQGGEAPRFLSASMFAYIAFGLKGVEPNINDVYNDDVKRLLTKVCFKII